MGTFDNLSQDNLAVMADSLSTSADLKEQAARDQLRVADDMHSIAAIAKEMHGALVEFLCQPARSTVSLADSVAMLGELIGGDAR